MIKRSDPKTPSTAGASQTRLQNVISAFGSDTARWPQQDRPLATEMNDANKRQMQHERALDHLLDQASNPQVPDGAQERLMARLHQLVENQPVHAPALTTEQDTHHRQHGIDGYGRPFSWSTICTLAAAMLIGIYLGGSGEFGRLLPGLNATQQTTDVASLNDDDIVDELMGWTQEDL